MQQFPTISQHIKKYNITPNKRLGQNFLFDQNLCDKIASITRNIENKDIIEIGPGPGGLTRSILSLKPKSFTVIEKDSNFLPILNDLKIYYQNENFYILNQDALRLDLSKITGSKLSIIANLPYNIGTELIFHWFEQIDYIDTITVMLQKEVVDRIVAKPNSKNYGKLSIMSQIYCEVDKKFDVPPEAFFPAPKVTSSIIQIIPQNNIPNKEIISKISITCTALFNQRRKMIKASLKQLFHDNTLTILSKLNIKPELRPENLSIEEITRIAHYL